MNSESLSLAGNASRWSEKEPQPFSQQLFQCVIVGALALASYFFFSHYIFQNVQVVGVSMSPTLHDADRYYVNRWLYHLREPRRSEIVVIKDPTDGSYAVKRIVALGGESIYFKHGRLYVNGKKLAEPYLPSGTLTFPLDKFQEQLVTCGRERFFVLGDNRNNSFDSRIYGPISRENIIGVILK